MEPELLDEIQKCENWSETIQTLWDQLKREPSKWIHHLHGKIT